MMRAAACASRLAAALLLGAHVFFAAIAAQAVFTRQIAALPRADPARVAAADLVGRMLASLDRWTLALAALCVLGAIVLARGGVARARRAAVPAILVGLCAAVSALVVTPKILALREAGETATRAFGRLHGVSAGLMVVEIALLVWAVCIAPPASPSQRHRLPDGDGDGGDGNDVPRPSSDQA